MTFAIFRNVTLGIILIFLSGCDKGQNERNAVLKGAFKQPPDTDVTLLPKYNFQAFAGTVWKTKVKVALADMEVYHGEHRVYLLPPFAFDRTHPDYRTPPCLEKVIVELPVGTRVRIERLTKDNGMAGYVQVTISLVDGNAFESGSGKVVFIDQNLLVTNQFLSPVGSNSKDWAVDPSMLEKAE